MPRTSRTVTLVLSLILSGSPVPATNEASGKADTFNAAPRMFLLDATQLRLMRQRIHDGDKTIAGAWAKLERDAQEALSEGPFSVVNKERTPPSGDKHYYMSQAPYFWPDSRCLSWLSFMRTNREWNR